MVEIDGEPRDMLTWKIAPFVAVHLACFAAFLLPFSWGLVGLAFGLYVLRMFAITAGYHRYFSHRAFKTSRAFQFVLAAVGQMSFQKGVLWWAAHHRHHHRYSDQHGDLHSPGLQGFLWAHVGWILSSKHNDTDLTKIGDFAKYPELVWLNKYHALPGVALGALLFFTGGLPALVWGLFISTVVTWHATFAINSLTHMIGRKRYATKDDSRNHWLLALVCLGEGWHNNHHYYKSSVRQGFFWWEFDFTFYVLKAFQALGLVWDLRGVPSHIRESNRIDQPAAAGFPQIPLEVVLAEEAVA